MTALAQLAAIAEQLDLAPVAAEARTFARRTTEGRFFVACVGQFKRGKSTLLNALAGAGPLLPTGVLPVTSVVTVLRGGDRLEARVLLAGGWESVAAERLVDWVSEEANPGNVKGVLGVEVFVPTALLTTGMCLVDTPGIGSIFEANTAATREFVPHVDAALVVVGADPPISADELDLVEQLAAQTPEMLLVLNKADRVGPAEIEAARRFCADAVARRLGRPIAPPLAVSALERLRGTGPARDWDQLVARLEHLAQHAGAGLVLAAERRGTAVVGARLLHEIAERRGALERPLGESERRLEALRACALASERALRDLAALLAAEERRLAETLRARGRAFVAATLPEAERLLRARLAAGAGTGSEAIATVHGILHEILERWRADEQPAANRMFTEGMQRFRELAERAIAQLVASGALDAERVPHLLSTEAPRLRAPSRLFYTHLMAESALSPLRAVVARLLPARWRQRLAKAHLRAYLERLIRTNASRITSDLIDQVAESRRALEAELRHELAEVHDAASRALERARRQLAGDGAAARAEMQRLAALADTVRALASAPA